MTSSAAPMIIERDYPSASRPRVADRRRDVVDLRVAQLGEHWQRQNSAGRRLGGREHPALVAERYARLLQVRGHRIMDAGVDLARLQLCLQRVALIALDHIEMIDV